MILLEQCRAILPEVQSFSHAPFRLSARERSEPLVLHRTRRGLVHLKRVAAAAANVRL